MNVALLIDTLAGGGSEGVVRRLALGLAARGHRPFVYCLKTARTSIDGLQSADVTVREARSLGLDPLLCWRLARWLWQDNVEIVHAHSCAALVWTLPVAKLCGIPVVHVRHGWSLDGKQRYTRWADSLSRFVDCIGINCESGRARLPRGRVAREAVYLPNGVDPAPVARETARQRLEELCGRAWRGPVVMCVANIRPEKDIRGLLPAFDRLRREHPNVELVCIGGKNDPAYWSEVERDVRDLHLDEHVHFPGYCEDACGLMAGADVLCLSSRTEAMPNVILEAMAQRVPLVATAVGDVGRLDPTAGPGNVILRHTETALLVPPGDPGALAAALASALRDRRAAQDRVERAAAEFAGRYTTERMVRRYEQFYVDCLRASRRHAARSPRCRRPRRASVLMLGPGPEQIGGMATSISVLMNSPLRERYVLRRLASPVRLAAEDAKGPPRGLGRGAALLAAMARHLTALGRLAHVLTKERIALLHVHTCSHFSFYRNLLDLAVAKLLRRAVVMHVRGGQFARFCAGSGRPGRWLIRRGLAWADAVIVPAHALGHALIPYTGRARLSVIPNAFDPDVLSMPRSGAGDRSARPCRFLYVGALTESKGLADLIEAAALLRRRRSAFELHIAGPASPTERARWEQYVRQAGLAEVVRLSGPVTGRAKARLLASADCFVLPSHSEGLPNAVLEAGAAGLPVIATAVGGVPELFAADEWPGAPLVPPHSPQRLADEMDRLARDEGLRRLIAERLQQRIVTEYCAERLAQRVTDLYERVLKPRDNLHRARTGARVFEWIARRVTYPVHERLCRRPTLRELESLEVLAAESCATVQHDCRRRLGGLLRFAARHLPYYAEQFARYGVNPDTADPLAELIKLPVLDKKDIRANRDGMVYAAVPGGPIVHRSGGTTGDTLHFYIDRIRQAQPMAARLFMQQRFGVRPGDRRVHLWGSPIESGSSRIKRIRDRLINELLLDAFEMSPQQIDAHLAGICAFRPRVIYGYPTALALLAQRAAAARPPHAFPWLRLVVLTGEEVAADQVAQVRAVFKCPVVAEYGSREVGLIAHECPRGQMHVIAPHVLVEVLANGCPAAPGVCGEIICTTLNTRAQPLIRYRLGDVGTLLPDDCDCGLPFPVLRLTGGKTTGFIALPDGRLCHGAVTSHVLRDQVGIVEFKTYQRSVYSFEVLLVVNQDFRPDTIACIRQRYRKLFGPQVKVDCCIVDRIPPDPSGKRRYVVSDVALGYRNFEIVHAPALTGSRTEPDRS